MQNSMRLECVNHQPATLKPQPSTPQKVMMGKHINGLQIRNNPDLTIGGYFLLAQVLQTLRFDAFSFESHVLALQAVIPKPYPRC